MKIFFNACRSFHAGFAAVVAIESEQHVTTLGFGDTRVGGHGSDSAFINDLLSAVEGKGINRRRATDGYAAGDARGADVHQRRRKIYEAVKT